MGVNGSTPGNTVMTVRSNPDPSPVLIGIPTVSPDCGLSGSLQVDNKQQSTSPDEVSNAQKMDTVIDGKLPNYQDSASVFSKLIVHELSHGSRDNLYLGCRMNFLSDVVQTNAPQVVDLGLMAINTLGESGDIGTPATRIWRPTDGSHWTAQDHAFG